MKNKIMSIALATVAAGALIGVGVAAYGQSVSAAATVTQAKVPERADNFRLVDQNSKAQELYYFKNAPAVVIVTQQNGSKNLRDAAPALKALRETYAAKDVPVLLLNSSSSDNRDTIAAEMKSLGLDLPVMLDDTQLIGEGLGVSRVAQAFVIDPKTWKVVYSGPIDDRFAGKTAKPNAKVKNAYVSDAVASLIAAQPVKVSTAKLDTPTLSFPDRDRAKEFVNISYEKEIAPLLAKNCVACHSEGGIGPFAMDSYEKVKGFAPMMREAIRTDRMPPYNADPHVNKFAGSMNLSNQDQKTLIHWIEAGAPRGAGADPLKINAKPAPEWELGTPDLVLTLPSFKVPASGIVDYQNPTVVNPLTEGRWLRASTVKPSDRRAVHHLLSNGAGGYAVGAETTVYPDGAGTWVEPGTTFRFQMHYTPYGKESVETTRIGLYFYPKDKTPQVMYRSAVVANAGIEIEPNSPRHEEIAYITFPENATLHSIFPHAHYRGDNMAISLLRPGETKEELILSLPKYDFNWQRGYDFATPIKLAPGTKLITRYQYDNSKNNPANPDPNITVTWGEQSHEEMQYTAIRFRWDDETVDNRKNEYQTKLEASRSIGIMDTNLDGKVAKTEVRGRMGQMITANFDKLDTDKDSFLSEPELAAVTGTINRRIADAQAQQSVGQ
ncbi:MAG: redoxin domain-containing protein [Hyphomonadaceae bacterium]|nr:redoxin domain-containing protein [Hyphomonadaceae bacterium]